MEKLANKREEFYNSIRVDPKSLNPNKSKKNRDNKKMLEEIDKKLRLKGSGTSNKNREDKVNREELI